MLKTLKYLRAREWTMVGGAIVFIVLQVFLDLKMPDYMSELTMLVQTEGSTMNQMLSVGGLMLLCALGSLLSAFIVGYFAARVAATLGARLREATFNKVLDLPMAETDKFSTSSLITRSTNDVTQVQQLVAMGLQVTIKAPIMAIWAIVKIAGKQWQWTLVTGCAVAVLIAILAVIIVFAVPRFTKVQKQTDELNAAVRENLTGLRVVRAYNAEEYQQDKFEAVNTKLTKTNLFVNRLTALMQPSMSMVNSGLTLGIYWVGAILISAAGAGAGLALFTDMVVFSSYAMQVIMGFMMLTMIFIMLPRAQVSARRINEVLETESSIVDGNHARQPDEPKGLIEFKNVSFHYPDTDKEGEGEAVLQDISFQVEKGQTLAIIGATGSGKSTLINLIPRFYDATEGQVLVDGVDVKDYSLNELRSKLGYISQRTVLFSGTVESNIAYGDNGGPDPGAEEVEKAAEIAQATEFVENLEGAYHAPVAQGGSNFSGGQKQRISIARAVCRNPEIMIFDDSFSALDYRTDRNLRQALNRELSDTTRIIVAQRIGTIKDADTILVMDEGRIVGSGTHAELLKTCEVYQEIASSQLTREELDVG
ncbi:MAG: ABC transporter ATP-binding protein [Oscillospiraceae bacterium]